MLLHFFMNSSLIFSQNNTIKHTIKAHYNNNRYTWNVQKRFGASGPDNPNNCSTFHFQFAPKFSALFEYTKFVHVVWIDIIVVGLFQRNMEKSSSSSSFSCYQEKFKTKKRFERFLQIVFGKF